MNKYILIFFFLPLTILSHTQEGSNQQCFHEHMMDRLIQSNPQVTEEIKALYNEAAKENQIQKGSVETITIPVIVHIIHQGEAIGTGTNLSQARIDSQIEILNQDYGFTNSDQNQIPSTFKA